MKKQYILPDGFLSSGVCAGIKKGSKKDLGLLFSEYPCTSAVFFTANRLKSAHIIYDKKILNGKVRAVLVNSGNANAFTGKRGVRDSGETAEYAEVLLGAEKKSALTASTGIIGRPLPVKKIKKALPGLVSKLSKKDKSFPDAILTTDTRRKTATVRLILDGKNVRITGAAKGAGMISPNMATMLAFVMTDAAIDKDLLKKAAKEALEFSFNRITVDGDMSTNDTFIVLANGSAGNKKVRAVGDYNKFAGALREVCGYLAESIVFDGEGATKFVRINVEGAKSRVEAKKTARAAANSLLFKTALFGGNPNFGRIVSAIGSSEVDMNLNKVVVSVGGVCVIKSGKIIESAAAAEKLKRKKIEITINLNRGGKKFFLLTTDLSCEYIKINAEYE